MKRVITIAWIGVLLAAVAIGGWLWHINVSRSASMSYSLEVVYGILPEDDHELKAWLESIPGFRTGGMSRAGKKLSLYFELGDSPRTDILAAVLKECDKLGYRDPGGFSGRFGRRKTFDFHTLRVEYRVLPDDDRALQAWLGKNPGVRSAKVSREGNVISLELIANDPPDPNLLGDIMRHCKSTGYGQQVGYISGFGPYR